MAQVKAFAVQFGAFLYANPMNAAVAAGLGLFIGWAFL